MQSLFKQVLAQTQLNLYVIVITETKPQQSHGFVVGVSEQNRPHQCLAVGPSGGK